MEKIIELELSKEEEGNFKKSIKAVQEKLQKILMPIKDINIFFEYIIVLTKNHSKDSYNLSVQIDVENICINHNIVTCCWVQF